MNESSHRESDLYQYSDDLGENENGGSSSNVSPFVHFQKNHNYQAQQNGTNMVIETACTQPDAEFYEDFQYLDSHIDSDDIGYHMPQLQQQILEPIHEINHRNTHQSNFHFSTIYQQKPCKSVKQQQFFTRRAINLQIKQGEEQPPPVSTIPTVMHLKQRSRTIERERPRLLKIQQKKILNVQVPRSHMNNSSLQDQKYSTSVQNSQESEEQMLRPTYEVVQMGFNAGHVPGGSFQQTQYVPMSSRNTNWRQKSTLNSTINQFKRSTILENLIFTPEDSAAAAVSTRLLEKQNTPNNNHGINNEKWFEKLREQYNLRPKAKSTHQAKRVRRLNHMLMSTCINGGVGYTQNLSMYANPNKHGYNQNPQSGSSQEMVPLIAELPKNLRDLTHRKGGGLQESTKRVGLEQRYISVQRDRQVPAAAAPILAKNQPAQNQSLIQKYYLRGSGSSSIQEDNKNDNSLEITHDHTVIESMTKEDLHNQLQMAKREIQAMRDRQAISLGFNSVTTQGLSNQQTSTQSSEVKKLVSGLDPMHLANLGGSSATPDFHTQFSEASNFRNCTTVTDNLKIDLMQQSFNQAIPKRGGGLQVYTQTDESEIIFQLKQTIQEQCQQLQLYYNEIVTKSLLQITFLQSRLTAINESEVRILKQHAQDLSRKLVRLTARNKLGKKETDLLISESVSLVNSINEMKSSSRAMTVGRY